MTSTLTSLLQFKLVWLAVVFSAVWAQAWIGVLAVGAALLHETVLRGQRHLLFPVLTVGAVGYFVDHLYVLGGLLEYPLTSLLPVPPFMALLWMNFALILDNGLDGLKQRPLVAAAIGGIGGPLAYSAGVGLGLIDLLAAPIVAYGAIAITWALGLPALLTSTRFWGTPALRPERTSD